MPADQRHHQVRGAVAETMVGTRECMQVRPRGQRRQPCPRRARDWGARARHAAEPWAGKVNLGAGLLSSADAGCRKSAWHDAPGRKNGFDDVYMTRLYITGLLRCYSTGMMPNQADINKMPGRWDELPAAAIGGR